MMRHAIRGHQRSSEEDARLAPIRWESAADAVDARVHDGDTRAVKGGDGERARALLPACELAGTVARALAGTVAFTLTAEATIAAGAAIAITAARAAAPAAAGAAVLAAAAVAAAGPPATRTRVRPLEVAGRGEVAGGGGRVRPKEVAGRFVNVTPVKSCFTAACCAAAATADRPGADGGRAVLERASAAAVAAADSVAITRRDGSTLAGLSGMSDDMNAPVWARLNARFIFSDVMGGLRAYLSTSRFSGCRW